MGTSITKDQLRQLAEHKGELDTDSGRVFDTFVGIHSGGKYHGAFRLSDPQPDCDYAEFSIASIISGTAAGAAPEPDQESEPDKWQP
jgi:hypothetical protein